MENIMERKLHEIKGLLKVTLAKQVRDLYNMKISDILVIEPIGVGELRLHKKSL